MSARAPERLIAEAMLAPSVHNVQPARWRIEAADRVLLLEDVRRRLAVGDPHGNDAGLSLGAAAEGLRLAASRAGLRVEADGGPLPPATATLVPVARYGLIPDGAAADPLAALVEARRSWRAAFVAATPADRAAAGALAGADAAVVTGAEALAEVAALSDRASLSFLRDAAFRGELLSWMRLLPRHPDWARDGLNAGAMAMGRVEAVGAGVVLGPAFRTLDRLHLAAPLLAEGGKLRAGAGLVVFHRDAGEAPFQSGRSLYRLWLRIEQAGFGAAVHAALADDPAAAAQLAQVAGVPAGRRVVSAFRIGRRPAGAAAPRARRTLAEVLA